MATKYFALLTNIGAAKLANATALGDQVEITQMAVGDGNGTLPTPNPAQTALTHELRRAQLNMLTIDPVNTNQIIAEQVIPEDVGGWWIREVGLFDKDGDMIAVANCAETYKPQLQEGSGRVQVIRVILIVSSTEAVTLKIDPSVVLATRKYVDDAVIEVKAYADDVMKKHVDAANPHDQYPLIANALKELADAGLVSKVLENLHLAEAGNTSGKLALIGNTKTDNDKCAVIVKTGSNANGKYRIWSDGSIDMWGNGIANVNGDALVNYPIALPVAAQNITTTPAALSTGTNRPITSVMVVTDLTTATKATFIVKRSDGTTSADGFYWSVNYAAF
ncbi:phage tail protein [Citrobacter farmeri]|uniref:phage tail protein n=1 Tax=Citrobacter farmeri TaxID=67824 RepID=UPI002DBD18A2|nr:phage tail protein [Citrobacter farmeri]MEC3934286.1 phage tail protein [Citrobacter farmeri]